MSKTAEDIAKETMAQMNETKEAKARAEDEKKKVESKDATAADPAEKAKTKEADDKAKKESEAKEARETAEKEVEEENRIVDADEETLSDEDKTKKGEIVTKRKEIEDKKKTPQDKVNERIGELTGKIKDLESSKTADKEVIEGFKNQLAELKESKDELLKKLNMSPDDKEKETLSKAEKDRIAKYLEDDKDKDYADRREMSDDDLQTWLSEDYVKAQRWLAENTYRRSLDRETDKANATTNKKAEQILNEQEKSAEKVTAKHPELDVAKRQKELADEGKNVKEIGEILAKENPKYKAFTEIMNKDPRKYLVQPNAPELIMAEMEKVLPQEKKEIKDDVAKEMADLKDEIDRLKNLDPNISSNRKAEKKKSEKISDLKQKQIDLAKKGGISEEALNKSIERRKTIPGAAYGKEEGEE